MNRIEAFLKKSNLWPAGRSDVMATNNTMRSGETFGLPFVNSVMYQDTPTWKSLRGFDTLFSWYKTNPILYAVVMIKAREYANMKLRVRNRKTLLIEPETTSKIIPAQVYRILKRPNPTQSTWEFLKQRKIFLEVCGNTFTNFATPLGLPVKLENIQALWNVWPQYMEVMLTGKYFSATEKKDIIKGWKFKFGQYEQEWNSSQILHQNSPNIDPAQGLIFGTSNIYSLIRPLSNIDMAYESRNVMMKNRGMRVIIASDKSDMSGKIPLLEDEKKSVEDAIKTYGLLEGQKQFFFTDAPIKATPINQNVKDLGLFDEIASDAMIVANCFGVPEILVKMYLEGTTYENQDASYRRLYEGTIIPEAQDDVDSMNSSTGLDQTEWEIIGTFDHLPTLQKSEKDRAAGNRDTSIYMERLFMVGAITHNEWLLAVNLPRYEGGDRRIFDFSEAEINILFRNANPTTGGNQQPSNAK